MSYAPSPQLLAAFRAIDKPFVCHRCSRIARKVSRSSIATSRRTFLSEPSPNRVADAGRQEKARVAEQKRSLAKGEQRPLAALLASRAAVLAEWKLTVGIEIHAELNTSRKLFSPAQTSLSDAPNTHVSVFDAALPGAQPQFQVETLLPALRAAIALDCEIQPSSGWDRKHYFWWDQPNGYQITQYYEPFARNGKIVLYEHDDIDVSDHPSIEIGIKQIQIEQDTAKTILQPPVTHLVDFNRVSHPLIEIITLPQIHSPKTAAALVRKVQSILKTVDSNTTGMEMGGLRADVNVSVSRRDQDDGVGGLSYGGVSGLGQRTEIKNLNSFKAVEEAIEAERDRQISVLENGGTIEGETRGWTIGGEQTRRIRGKEGEVDYRYMPDPDLPPLMIGQDLIKHLRETLPPLPDTMLELLTNDPNYGITMKDAKTLVMLDDGERLEYYMHIVYLTRQRLAASQTQTQTHANDVQRNVGRHAANFVLHELGALLTSSGNGSWSANCVSASHIAQILCHRLSSHITLPTAKRLLWLTLNGSFAINKQHLASQSMSEEEIEAAEARAVTQYIYEKNLKLKPMSDKEYLALAIKLVNENPKMAETVKKEEVRAKGEAAGKAATDIETASPHTEAGQQTKRKGKGKGGKMMWFVGQMLSRGDGPRMVPDQCERAMRRALAQMSS